MLQAYSQLKWYNNYQMNHRFQLFRDKLDAFKRLSRTKKILLIGGVSLGLFIIIGLLTTIFFAASLSSKERIMNRNNTGVTLLDRNGDTFYKFYNPRSDTYLELNDISPRAREAVIAAEDKNFYEHSGFSVTGIAQAVYENLRPDGLNSGGSTITQQLVKNALLSQDRNLLRKYQELVLSIEIERRYDKDEILEMYLNSVYFGEGYFGIGDAAQGYFGVNAKDLNLAQASMLAGLLPAPAAYSPITGDEEKAKQRQSYVLDRMTDDGYIETAAAEDAKTAALDYQPQSSNDNFKAPHFALMVKAELEEKYGEERVARSGYIVKTSLDLGWQNRAEAAVAEHVNSLGYADVSNGAAVVLDPKTAMIRALVGSKDWDNEDFGKVNMATAGRQPGSSIKPLVYATGIEEKTLSAASILNDKPTDFGGGYEPENYDLGYRGDVTVRRALANSLNIPAVQALQKIGVEDLLDQAKELGITTLTEDPSEYGLSIALGSGSVKLTELTNSYATMANGGRYHDLETIESITDKYDGVIFTSNASSRQAISAQTSFIVSSMLSDDSARAETFGGSLSIPGHQVAVKTGTTEDYRDALTVGYTPSLAIGVWVGNNDNTPMTQVGGSLGAAPIWSRLMNELLAGKPNEPFSQPDGIIAQLVCRGSGAYAENPGDNTYTEYFRQGTLPNQRCNTERPEPEEEEPVEEPVEEEPIIEEPIEEEPVPEPEEPVEEEPPEDGGDGDTPPDDGGTQPLIPGGTRPQSDNRE